MQKSSQQVSNNFSEKYSLYSEMLFRICMIYLGNKEDVEEAMQEAFIKLMFNCPKFNNAEHEKISQTLKITEFAIKMRLKRARNILKMQLEGDSYE